MKIKVEKKVVVVTPTLGTLKLYGAVNSVSVQSYSYLEHLLVLDGPKLNYLNEIDIHNMKDSNRHIKSMHIPYNTGGNGFYGHRIYAAIGHLVDADYIAFLDEDNWYDPNHIETLVDTIESGDFDFSYSLRKIWGLDKLSSSDMCEDNCESLGKWPVWPSLASNTRPSYLIDTSSYLFKRDFLVKHGHHWHWGWGGDRRFFEIVKSEGAKYECNYAHTLNYRLDGNPNSVNMEFFVQGNAFMESYYNGVLPWKH